MTVPSNSALLTDACSLLRCACGAAKREREGSSRMSFEPTLTFWVIALSELLAVWVIWRLWRSADHIVFKVALSLIALIPVLGPIVAIWISNFPESAPKVLQDRWRGRTDVYDRWRGTLNERNPERRLQRWRTLMTKHRNEDP